MLKGFRDFLMQGNVIDLATAVVIGTAFGAVVNALVESVLMPLVASVVGGEPDFDEFAVVRVLDGPPIQFGVLLTTVVNFILIAAAIYFVVIVPMNKMIAARHKALGEPEVEEEENITLLKEIRDQLKAQTEVTNPAYISSLVEAERRAEEEAAKAEEAKGGKGLLGKAKGVVWGE